MDFEPFSQLGTLLLIIGGDFIIKIRPEDDVPFDVVNPAHEELRMAGLWLAAHKYFEVDRRRGNNLTWQYAPRLYHKHFPLPRLKRLHPTVQESCDKGLVQCVREIGSQAQESFSLSDVTGEPLNEEEVGSSYPFETALELFQFRTTASYYMCWFTLQKLEFLMNYMEGKNCLVNLDKVKEKEWAGIDVIDFRTDSHMDPFACALIQFCPDPCYGIKKQGSVRSQAAMNYDRGNPCRHLKDKQCKWNYEQNGDFESLRRNRFNVSCNCQKEKPGFEWNSRWGLCVDIDECLEKDSNCNQGKICHNTLGNFTCVCPRGQKYSTIKKKCIETIPLPAHSRTRKAKVKPKRQKTALARLLEYILGLRTSTKP